jgi:hypothetical protein
MWSLLWQVPFKPKSHKKGAAALERAVAVASADAKAALLAKAGEKTAAVAAVAVSKRAPGKAAILGKADTFGKRPRTLASTAPRELEG